MESPTSESQNQNGDNKAFCSFVSIDYIICECGETFPTENELKVHLETQHPHKTERKEYKCGLCKKHFATEAACVKHHQKTHTVKIIKPPQPTIKYIIQPVKKEPEDMYQFRINTDCVYNQDVSDKSPVSNVPIKTESDGHLIVTSGDHPGTRKKFVRKNIKNRVCEVCGKKYSSNAALRYHQRVHTGERPYQCDYCEKAFTMPLFLQIHTRIHTGERPYQCPHCPKAFGNKAALLRHDRVHTGVKPYACPTCFKTFTQSNSMKLHVHTVHLKLPAPYKSKRRKERARLKQKEDMPEWCMLKTEETAEESIFYEDTADEVLYEVVYEQE